MAISEREYLRNLLHLQATVDARTSFDKYRQDIAEGKPDRPRFNEEWFTDQIRRCEERDAIMAARPNGCWCLGLGSSLSQFCGCHEGAEARQRDEAERDLRNHQRLEAQWVKAIPLRFQSWTLDGSPAKDVAQLLRDSEYPMSWFLWGGHGRGKTGLAVGYARLWRERGRVVRFCSVPDLLSELRATYQYRDDGPTEHEVIAKYADADVLILDDLGAEQVKSQAWVADRLYQIIGKRHAEQLITVFTSNSSIAEVGTKIGERITWRILEMTGEDNIVEVVGPNLRDRHA